MVNIVCTVGVDELGKNNNREEMDQNIVKVVVHVVKMKQVKSYLKQITHGRTGDKHDWILPNTYRD